MAKSSLSYTERTLACLRRNVTAKPVKVERWNPYGGADKPNKAHITDPGESFTYKQCDTISMREFNYENSKLNQLNKKPMQCKEIPDGKHGIRQDVFGFIDIICLFTDTQKIVGIQSTGPSGFHSHLKKIKENCAAEAIAWLKCGGKIELWSWSKQPAKTGSRMLKWTARVEEVTLDMFVLDFLPPTAAPVTKKRSKKPATIDLFSQL